LLDGYLTNILRCRMYSEELVQDDDCDVLLGIRKEVIVAHLEALFSKSNSQRFQNWHCTSVLHIFTARLRNFQKWRLP
jgi:hypothetical protein